MIFRISNSAAALLASSLAAIFCNLHALSASAQAQSGEQRPSVTITVPKKDSTYPWNALVNYRIAVNWQGKSTQYDEIPSDQVLLKATYIPDISAISAQTSPAATRVPPGVLYIMASRCLGCHQFKAKSMGPSFAAIGQRYPESQVATDLLTQKIRHGTTGAWGQNQMPPQPDLTEDQLHAIVLWITKNAADPNVYYYVGTDGTFRMESSGPPDPKAGMLLTASFTSLVPAVNPDQAPGGEDTVIVMPQALAK